MTAPPPPPTGGVSRPPTSLDVGAARASRTCSIDGCDERHYARGWCNTHYSRWYQKLTDRLTPGTPLTCQCYFPNVGPNDECVRCHRVIAEHVHRRRAAGR